MSFLVSGSLSSLLALRLLASSGALLTCPKPSQPGETLTTELKVCCQLPMIAYRFLASCSDLLYTCPVIPPTGK